MEQNLPPRDRPLSCLGLARLDRGINATREGMMPGRIVFFGPLSLEQGLGLSIAALLAPIAGQSIAPMM